MSASIERASFVGRNNNGFCEIASAERVRKHEIADPKQATTNLRYIGTRVLQQYNNGRLPYRDRYRNNIVNQHIVVIVGRNGRPTRFRVVHCPEAE